MHTLLLFSLFLVTCHSGHLSEWHEDLRIHECRSCQPPLIDLPANCLLSGYSCDENQPLRAAVLNANDECRCQSLTCAKRGWRLAADGLIIYKARCSGKQWFSETGAVVQSAVCAKVQNGPIPGTTTPSEIDTTTPETETTTPETKTTTPETKTTTPQVDTTTTTAEPITTEAVECIQPPEPWLCDKRPYPGEAFSPICFSPIDGVTPICHGNFILVTVVPDNENYYMALSSPASCDFEGSRKYKTTTFGRPVEAAKLSCVPCVYKSGEASTTFQGEHKKAVYNEGVVTCEEGNLYGKTENGGFNLVADGTAYYTYDSDKPGFTFLALAGWPFDADFYCDMTGLPSK